MLSPNSICLIANINQEKAESLAPRSLFSERGKEKDEGIRLNLNNYGKLLFIRLCIRG